MVLIEIKTSAVIYIQIKPLSSFFMDNMPNLHLQALNLRFSLIFQKESVNLQNQKNTTDANTSQIHISRP